MLRVGKLGFFSTNVIILMERSTLTRWSREHSGLWKIWIYHLLLVALNWVLANPSLHNIHWIGGSFQTFHHSVDCLLEFLEIMLLVCF